MKIIAHHAHIFEEVSRKDGTVQALLDVMDQCGIDQAVCFAPFHDYFHQDDKSPNRWMYEEIKDNDRLMGFGTIDFTKNNLKEQVEEIYDLGLHGIKLHPAYQKFKIDEDRACEVYEVAEKRGLPLSFHTGVHFHRISSYNTLLYDEIAYRFPELKICMEHVGGWSFFKDAVAVMVNNRKRMYGGITSVFDTKINKFWYLGKENVKDLIWQTSIDQCIFGLDFPYNTPEMIMDAMSQLRECVEELGLGEEGLQKVFGENLLTMIGK